MPMLATVRPPLAFLQCPHGPDARSAGAMVVESLAGGEDPFGQAKYSTFIFLS